MSACIMGKGIYGFSEAARLTDLSPRRVRAWFQGWPRGDGPVLVTDVSDGQTHSNLTFLDLIDVLVAGHLRNMGLSLAYLRRAYQALARDLDADHPFARHELLTDGVRIFTRTTPSDQDVELRDVLDRQQAFDQILRPYLTRIEWDHETHMAIRWRIADGVMLDPAIRFGKPILADSAIPTAILASAYTGNHGDVDLVADWYGVTPAEVKRAVAFEQRIIGEAA